MHIFIAVNGDGSVTANVWELQWCSKTKNCE